MHMVLSPSFTMPSMKSTSYPRGSLVSRRMLKLKAQIERGSSHLSFKRSNPSAVDLGQAGVKLGSSWGQAWVKLGSSLGQHGVNMGSTWGQPRFKLRSTWGQAGVDLQRHTLVSRSTAAL